MYKFKSEHGDDQLKTGLYFYFTKDSIIKIITLQKAIALKCTDQKNIYKIMEEDCDKVGGYICKCLTTSTIGDNYHV